MVKVTPWHKPFRSARGVAILILWSLIALHSPPSDCRGVVVNGKGISRGDVHPLPIVVYGEVVRHGGLSDQGLMRFGPKTYLHGLSSAVSLLMTLLYVSVRPFVIGLEVRRDGRLSLLPRRGHPALSVELSLSQQFLRVRGLLSRLGGAERRRCTTSAGAEPVGPASRACGLLHLHVDDELFDRHLDRRHRAAGSTAVAADDVAWRLRPG